MTLSIVIIGLVCFLGSLLTFFSGFGLGTLLMPVFAMFFPIEIAISLTAIVHFLNNVFKFSLTFKNIDTSVLLKFGIPSVVGAFIGAYLLQKTSHLQFLTQYTLYGFTFQITLIKIIIALLLLFFSLMELIPKLNKLQFAQKYLTFGGIISGFFGGLSGHQGALRSAFLVKLGLVKEVYISTGIAIACLVDISRMSMYSKTFDMSLLKTNSTLIITSVIFAFVGAFLGNKLLKKTTFKFVQIFVSVFLIIFAVLLGFGIV